MSFIAKSAILAAALIASSAAEATTIVIMVDAATMERRTMVLEDRGPDRVLLCTAPPSVAGCRDVTARR